MVDRSGRHPTERADLFGMRLVAANESGDGGRLSEETVKQLTSRESIRARRMREDSREFTPSHTVILATNHKPEIRGTDYGIWRRVCLVPFSVTIPPEDRDKDLANKLRAEWPSILRWAVSGCLEWQKNGLQPPQEVLEATAAYQAEQDLLNEWLDERCVVREKQETHWRAVQELQGLGSGSKRAATHPDEVRHAIDRAGIHQGAEHGHRPRLLLRYRSDFRAASAT